MTRPVESRQRAAAAADIQAVWRQYKAKKSEALRNVLVERYLPLVRYVAERVAAKLPKSVELDDLMSAGVFGLLDAIDGFDLSRDVKFETYCTTRVRGAILDELRAMDWVPRLVRARAHKLDQAVRELEAKLGRYPTDEEVAKKLGLSAAAYEDLVKEASAVAMFSLTAQRSADDDADERHTDILEDKRFADPTQSLHRSEIKQRVVQSLSEVEKLVVVLYYYEELTMKEIGAILDLSESRVCQIHSKIITRLRYQFRHLQNDL